LSLHGTHGLADALPALADEIQRSVSFGVGRKNRSDDAPVDHPLFSSASWDALPPHIKGNLREKARAQLGCSAGASSSSCTTITTSPGVKSTTASR
jgi:hypothetical protein